MKRYTRFLWLILALGLIWPGSAWADSPVKPGDEIGPMVVTTGGFEIVPIWAFCVPAFLNPGVTTTECNVPALPELAIGHGWWAADETLRDASWEATTWELYLDDQQVDLDAFGTFDADLPQTGLPGHDVNEEVITKLRSWDVVLEKPTPGAHTLRSVLHLAQTVDDGFHVTEAGTYELVANFTVAPEEPAELPTTGGEAGDWLAVMLALAGLGLLGGGWLVVRRQQQ